MNIYKFITKKLFLLFYLAIVLTCISSCKENAGYNDARSFSIDNLVKKEQLKGQILNLDSLENPDVIYIMDSILYVVNQNGPFLLNTFNIKSGKKTGQFLSIGSGPNELIHCNSLQFTEDEIWAFDMMQNKFLVYKNGKTATESFSNVLKCINFRDLSLQNPLIVDSNVLVGNDLRSSSQLLTFFDNNGKKKNKDVPFPNFNEMPESDFLKKRFFECRMAIDEYRNIYLAYLYTDLIDIYDENGRLKNRIFGPNHYYPELKEVNTGLEQYVSMVKDKTKICYLSPVALKEGLMVLYYGITPEKDNFLTNNLFLFDKQGNMKILYHLDVPIFNFCVNESERRIYGTTLSPEYSIVYFDY